MPYIKKWRRKYPLPAMISDVIGVAASSAIIFFWGIIKPE